MGNIPLIHVTAMVIPGHELSKIELNYPNALYINIADKLIVELERSMPDMGKIIWKGRCVDM